MKKNVKNSIIVACSLIACIGSVFLISKKIKERKEENLARLASGESLYQRYH
jgi:hypothetical protein